VRSRPGFDERFRLDEVLHARLVLRRKRLGGMLNFYHRSAA
jgi:hypothetical protein